MFCDNKNKNYGTITIEIREFQDKVDMLVILFEKNELYGDSIKNVDTVKITHSEFIYKFKLNQPKTALFKLYKNNKEVGLITFKNNNNTKNYFANPLIGNENIIISINKMELINKMVCFRAIIYGDKENQIFTKNFNSKLITHQDINSNKNNYATLYKLCSQKNQFELEKLKQYSSLFDEKIKNSNAYLSLINYINIKQKLKIDGYSKNFDWLDINGKHYSFKKVNNNKKLTLLVFWASWCKPCRNEIPNLKMIHKKYKNELSIVSLSIDEDYNSWKDAVIKEQMPWTNLSGLPIDNKAIETKYNITEVPTLILTNHNGEYIERIYDLDKLNQIIIKLTR